MSAFFQFIHMIFKTTEKSAHENSNEKKRKCNQNITSKSEFSEADENTGACNKNDDDESYHK